MTDNVVNFGDAKASKEDVLLCECDSQIFSIIELGGEILVECNGCELLFRLKDIKEIFKMAKKV